MGIVGRNSGVTLGMGAPHLPFGALRGSFVKYFVRDQMPAEQVKMTEKIFFKCSPLA